MIELFRSLSDWMLDFADSDFAVLVLDPAKRLIWQANVVTCRRGRC